MKMPHEINTVSEILKKLRLEKKDNEFRMTEDGFKATGTKHVFQPEELIITNNIVLKEIQILRTILSFISKQITT